MSDGHPKQLPLALFDALENLDSLKIKSACYVNFQEADYVHAKNFLRSYQGSQGTFNSYRREVERLLHWTWIIIQKKLPDLRREDLENYIRFCQNPPESWIGLKKVPRFYDKNGLRAPNPEWHPFVVTLSKVAHRQGETLDPKKYELSQGAIKEMFAVLSTFFNYMLQEEYVYLNPIALIRQKSKFIRKTQGQTVIRRLTDLQWEYTIQMAQTLAKQDPEQHERTLFILSALYGMYLRISELSASGRWLPKMNHFQRDPDGNWWFLTVGKGNKERRIAVSDAMLSALKRWRLFLGYPALPHLADQSPLLPKARGKGPITSTTYIREVVQACFDASILQLQQDNLSEEAESMFAATVHWLRHTGISDDVKKRPREHVRDDAGHSTSATTDKYIDIELRERHRSAKRKQIDPAKV